MAIDWASIIMLTEALYSMELPGVFACRHVLMSHSVSCASEALRCSSLSAKQPSKFCVPTGFPQGPGPVEGAAPGRGRGALQGKV
jgi:hypothetical protein